MDVLCMLLLLLPLASAKGVPLEPKPLEPMSLGPKPLEPKPLEPKPLEPKSLGPKPLEPKPLEPKPLGPKPLEPKPLEPKPLEPQPLEPKPLELWSSVTKPLEPKMFEPKPLEPTTLQPKTLEPNMLQPKTLEPKMSETKTLETTTSEPTSFEQMMHFDLPGHLQDIIEHADIEGFSLATVYAAHSADQQETGQNRSDIENLASDSSYDEPVVSLHLSSGETLRMSLMRRSVDLTDATLTEISEDGTTVTVPLEAGDCFFSGPLVGEDGFANLIMCDGELMGSVTTATLDYNVHALPTSFDKHFGDDVIRVLVTWKPVEMMSSSGNETIGRQSAGGDIFDDVDEVLDVPEDEPEDDVPKRERRSIKDRRVVIEFADFLDERYIDELNKNEGVRQTASIKNVIINKWSAAQRVLSQKASKWDITLRLVRLEIWRKDPSWYKAKDSDKMVNRLQQVCQQYKKRGDFDLIMLHTGKPLSRIAKSGSAWLAGLCRPAWRCAVSRATNTNFVTELHEFGHSMGLSHDNRMRECSKGHPGFMGGSKDYFRACYNPILDKNFKNPKKDCIFTLQSKSSVKTFN